MATPTWLCEAEIGGPGTWHGCRRTAKYRFLTRSGMVLHYCEAHKSHAGNPKYASGDPATLELI